MSAIVTRSGGVIKVHTGDVLFIDFDGLSFVDPEHAAADLQHFEDLRHRLLARDEIPSNLLEDIDNTIEDLRTVVDGEA